MILPIAAALFFVFEVWQLVVSERYLGIRQIARNGDPRELGLSEVTACVWTTLIALYVAWMITLCFFPVTRVHGICLLLVSFMGYSLRRNVGIRWILIVLTLEGAVRIGLLVSLFGMWWRRSA